VEGEGWALGVPERTAAAATASGFTLPDIPDQAEYDNPEGDKNNGAGYDGFHKNSRNMFVYLTITINFSAFFVKGAA
jgi:hypothetical protein